MQPTADPITVTELLDQIHRGTGHVRTVEQIAYSLDVERRDLLPATEAAQAQGLITLERDTHSRSNLLRLTETGRGHRAANANPAPESRTCPDCKGSGTYWWTKCRNCAGRHGCAMCEYMGHNGSFACPTCKGAKTVPLVPTAA